MALKLKKRADVDGYFLSLMDRIYKDWMAKEERVARTWPGGCEAYMERNRLRHARILNLLHGGDGHGRSGRTYEITKLRSLSYARFTAIRHDGQAYLMGETTPIVIQHAREDYHLGVYQVFVATGAILQGNLNQIHMIPLKAPKTNNRFMHHLAYENDSEHPLDYRTNTCWGNFGSTIKPYAEDADIPELFRGLYVYLARYNAGSPLRRIESLGWDTETPWEAWNAD